MRTFKKLDRYFRKRDLLKAIHTRKFVINELCYLLLYHVHIPSNRDTRKSYVMIFW